MHELCGLARARLRPRVGVILVSVPRLVRVCVSAQVTAAVPPAARGGLSSRERSVNPPRILDGTEPHFASAVLHYALPTIALLRLPRDADFAIAASPILTSYPLWEFRPLMVRAPRSSIPPTTRTGCATPDAYPPPAKPTLPREAF